MLTSLPPNQNALIGIESISLFDPVHLRRIHRFYPTAFRVENAGFSLHAQSHDGGLDDRELDAARFLGAQAVHGHALATTRGVWAVGEGLHVLEGALPRAYMLTREAVERIDATAGLVAIGETLLAIQSELTSAAAVTGFEFGPRGLSFHVPGPCDGVLVVAQAYARSWRMNGLPPQPFANLLCAWDLKLAEPARVEVDYWPPGLNLALLLVGAGSALALFASVWIFGARAQGNAPKKDAQWVSSA